MATKNVQVKPGDMVILGAFSGLGTNPYLVLDVALDNRIHNLYVQGLNGQTWWARSDGAKVVQSPLG